jgi:hypothetical protein
VLTLHSRQHLLYVERVFGRRFSSRRRCTWTSVEARSASFLLFLMATALCRASNATASAATAGIRGAGSTAWAVVVVVVVVVVAAAAAAASSAIAAKRVDGTA